MREQLRRVLTSLPPEGIAVHGTNLARAERIQQEGFIPQDLCVGTNLHKTYYIVQPPNLNPSYSLLHLQEMKAMLNDAYRTYASRASRAPLYELTHGPDDKIPTLVVFRPLARSFDASLHAHMLYPFPFVASDTKPIPAKNVYGIIPVPERKSAKKLISEAVRILLEKGVINSVKPPQRQEA